MDGMELGIPRLLVVDDNENIHEDMKFILNPAHGTETDAELARLKADLFGELVPEESANCVDVRYRIDDAWQSAEAVSMVKTAVAAGDPYALVFLDVNMPPGLDGIQTVGLLWACDPHLEVVICTAYSDYTWEQIISRYGQTDHLLFVRKPFDSVSIKQIALSLTKKCQLAELVRHHIESLESEVQKRTRELEQSVRQLTKEMELRRDKECQLAHLAHYDMLTGLLNRHSFYGFVGEIVEKNPMTTGQSSHALLFVDIDEFKQVNDRWGHDMGDRLLVEIASRIREASGKAVCRLDDVVSLLASPTPENAIFRLGGDEFTLLVEYQSKEEVRAISERILNAICEPFFLREQEICISCSIGISLLHGDASDFGTFLKHADMAMYKAKERGGAFVFHDQPHGTGWFDPAATPTHRYGGA